ncbi:aromatic peroxygenase precursor [Panaeolus papilionaceus]|nr:aromatic peroxygenase precursor [Panaeolus papilionaceus]
MQQPFVVSVLLAILLCGPALAFPAHASLAGLSAEDLENILPTLTFRPPANPTPGPLNDTSAKLVNDAAHPWRPLRVGDIRGPCPGLNTLASHGWLPRDGIATPSQIMLAVQEGFNMNFGTALLVTYAAFLVDGNVVTNRLSIGGKTLRTGLINPPAPAIVGGLDTHAVFEGKSTILFYHRTRDASMTRGDAFFGNNHSFNETLFQEMVDASNQFGAGKYNLTVAGELRHRRIQDSIATNPQFSFVSPRFFTAFAESTFPINFFIDGRNENGQLDMDVARGFFQNSRMPDGFFRASSPRGADGITQVFAAHPIAPGRNVGGVNNYVPDPTSADFSNFCLLYTNFVNQTLTSLYPHPVGVLRQALNFNLNILFQAFKASGCTQVFPFGQD